MRRLLRADKPMQLGSHTGEISALADGSCAAGWLQSLIATLISCETCQINDVPTLAPIYDPSQSLQGCATDICFLLGPALSLVPPCSLLRDLLLILMLESCEHCPNFPDLIESSP